MAPKTLMKAAPISDLTTLLDLRTVIIAPPVTLSHISNLITIKTEASPEMAFEFIGPNVGEVHIKLPFKTN